MSVMTIPKTIRVNPELYKQLKVKLVKEDMAISEWLRQKMREELDMHNSNSNIYSGKTQIDISAIKGGDLSK